MNKIKLSQLQEQVLKFFGRDKFGKNFYWTGGTLLAYSYFGHRLSIDLDFFSDNLFSDDDYLLFINRLKQEVGGRKITLTQQQNRRLYLIERGRETLKIELVFFPFPAIEKRKQIKKFSLAADSLIDLITNKTLSTYQRSEPKDVYDLYWCLNYRPKYNLFKSIKLVEKKFGVSLEPALLLAKINELAGRLNLLQPLLIKPEKDLSKKVKSFFQQIFNSWARKQIR